MPAELENASATFTDEAEVALKRVLARLERQLRARSLDEAVRGRGLPAEVTGSDIERAFNRLMSRRYIARREFGGTFTMRPSEGRIFPEYIGSTGTQAQRRRTTFTESLAKVYMWLGVIGALVGLLYAPFYHQFKSLSKDPAWRVGLLIFLTSTGMFLIGLAVKTYISKLYISTRIDQPKSKIGG